MANGNAVALRSTSASRSARLSVEARFFFQPAQLRRQAANLSVQLIQLLLVLSLGRLSGLGIV